MSAPEVGECDPEVALPNLAREQVEDPLGLRPRHQRETARGRVGRQAPARVRVGFATARLLSVLAASL